MNCKWFDLWFEDKTSIIETMYRNMNSDIENGYNPNGYSIRFQLDTIRSYTEDFHNAIEVLKTMEEKQAERWCYYDMKKRGAIA